MTDITWPPMPEPTLEDHEYELWGQNVRANFYTAKQVRQQRRACALAALDAAIRVCAEHHAQECRENVTGELIRKLKDTL